MKKLITAILLFICSFNTSEAQEIAKNAIGIRVGSFDSFIRELAYQRGLSDIDRLEFNLGYKKSTEVLTLLNSPLYINGFGISIKDFIGF